MSDREPRGRQCEMAINQWPWRCTNDAQVVVVIDGEDFEYCRKHARQERRKIVCKPAPTRAGEGRES